MLARRRVRHQWDIASAQVVERREQIGWGLSAVDDPTKSPEIIAEIDAVFDEMDVQTRTMTEKAMQMEFLAGFGAIFTALDTPDDLSDAARERHAASVAELGLTNVTVHRGRAEEMSLLTPVVTARAVASLDKLMAWSFPMLSPDGRLLALKGEAAQTELEQVAPMLTRDGVAPGVLHLLGADLVSEPIRVVEITRPPAWKPPTGSRSARAKGTPRAGGRTATRGRRTRRH